MSLPDSVERFEALENLSGLRSAFITRIPAIDVDAEREVALARLKPSHDALIAGLGFSPPVTAEQVHGNHVAIVDRPQQNPIPGVDGLIAATPGIALGIYVADCAAIYVVDPVRRVIALLHSGRKGTELNILGSAVHTMREEFGCDPRDLTVVVSPCIRPPHYEIDFAATIAEQARVAGVRSFFDSHTCTASNLHRYYSYRMEKGRTGRMLALLEIES